MTQSYPGFHTMCKAQENFSCSKHKALEQKKRNLFSTAINESMTNPTMKTLRISIASHGFLHCNKKQSRARHSKHMTLRKLESFSKKKINPTFQIKEHL